MKKLIAMLTAAICTFSLVGCGEEKENIEKIKDVIEKIEETHQQETQNSIEEIKNHYDIKISENEIEEGELAYIGIRNLFHDYSAIYYENFMAYKETLNSDISTLDKVSLMNIMYFDNSNFYYFENNMLSVKCYQGNISIDNKKLIPKYINMFMIEDECEKYNIDNYSDEIQREVLIAETMKEANSDNIFINVPCYPGVGINNDKYPSSISKAKIVGKEGGYSTHSGNSCLYTRKKYLVQKQEGYSFKKIKNNKEFTITFDNSDFYQDEMLAKRNSEIIFNSDGTWKGSIKIDGIDKVEETGKWEFKDDNLLVLYTPKEYQERFDCEEYVHTMFYVDFDEEEIAIPAFVECEEALEIARKAVKELE